MSGTGAAPIVWRFEAIADGAPTIAFERPPQADQRNQMVLAYKVEDDYGVKEAEATMTLAPSAQALQRPGARPLAELPPLPLTLPQAAPAPATARRRGTFTTHPFAGLQVAVKLKARDDAGNEGFSDTLYGTLPSRVFSKPIPRVLVEQRRLLALDANAAPRVARALEALTTAPDVFSVETPVYLGLRTAYFRLVRARNDEALREVMDYLWDIAVRMEDGDVSEAERAVSQAAERLRQAIERGASEEEIRRLSQDLRQAMDRLMRELAEQAMRNRQDGRNQQQQAQRDPNTRTVRPQDLRDMLNRIETSPATAPGPGPAPDAGIAADAAGPAGRPPATAAAGREWRGRRTGREPARPARRHDPPPAAAARRHLPPPAGTASRPAQPAAAAQRPARPAGPAAARSAGRETARHRASTSSATPSASCASCSTSCARSSAGRARAARVRKASRASPGGSEAGRQAQEGLDGAGRAMREAERALGRGNGQGATDAQGRALRNLQRGAQGLAQQMQEGQGQGQGRDSRPGRAGGPPRPGRQPGLRSAGPSRPRPRGQ